MTTDQPPPDGPPPAPAPTSPYAPAGAAPLAGAHPYVPGHPGGVVGPPPPRLPFPGAGWFLLLTVIGIGAQLVISAIGGILVVVILQPDLTKTPENVFELIPPQAFMVILVVASLAWPAVALLAARIARLDFRDAFRWRGSRPVAALLAVPLGAALVPVALLLENILARMLPRSSSFVVQLMAEKPSVTTLALLGFTLIVCAPVGEELLFRGLGFRGLERRYGFLPAALMVSIVFSVVHLNFTALLALTLVSLVLCWLVSRTDSLLPAIVVHAVYNGSQFLMMLGAEITPEAAKKALKSTELEIPLWLVLAGLTISGLCLFLINRFGSSPAPVSDIR